MACGSTQSLQCAHIIPRGYRQVRWDSRNAMTLCAKHHVYYEHRPLEWQAWINERASRGDGKPWHERRLEALEIKADWRDLAQDWIGEGYA